MTSISRAESASYQPGDIFETWHRHPSELRVYQGMVDIAQPTFDLIQGNPDQSYTQFPIQEVIDTLALASVYKKVPIKPYTQPPWWVRILPGDDIPRPKPQWIQQQKGKLFERTVFRMDQDCVMMTNVLKRSGHELYLGWTLPAYFDEGGEIVFTSLIANLTEGQDKHRIRFSLSPRDETYSITAWHKNGAPAQRAQVLYDFQGNILDMKKSP